MAKRNKKKKIDFYKFEEKGGIEQELYNSKKYTKIDVCYGDNGMGLPLIQIQGMSKKKPFVFKPILQLHLQEALELKSIIDRLIFSYFQDENEKLSDKVIFKEE